MRELSIWEGLAIAGGTLLVVGALALAAKAYGQGIPSAPQLPPICLQQEMGYIAFESDYVVLGMRIAPEYRFTLEVMCRRTEQVCMTRPGDDCRKARNRFRVELLRRGEPIENPNLGGLNDRRSY